MDFLIPTIIIVAVVIVGLIIIDRRVKTVLQSKNDDKSILMLNQNVQGMQQSLSARLDKAAESFAVMSRQMGQVTEIGRNMKDLQDFLRSPKLRGNIGEQVMNDLLEQYFPRAHFDLQHTFKTGERVDAVLKTDKGIISVDAKFPLENFQKVARAEDEEAQAAAMREFVKDVKKHIADISKKYILPAEGTVDFAIMYVPSEPVYYEIIRQQDDINNYANERRVLLVSPNSFYYFLKVLMIGLEGKRVEENAKKILETMRAIQRDSEKFGEQLGVMTTHVTNAKNAVDRVNTEYIKLSGKIDDVRLLK